MIVKVAEKGNGYTRIMDNVREVETRQTSYDPEEGLSYFQVAVICDEEKMKKGHPLTYIYIYYNEDISFGRLTHLLIDGTGVVYVCDNQGNTIDKIVAV